MIMAGFSIRRQWWRAAHQLYRCRPRERDLYFKIAIYKLVLIFLLRMDFWHVSCTRGRFVSESPQYLLEAIRIWRDVLGPRRIWNQTICRTFGDQSRYVVATPKVVSKSIVIVLSKLFS